MGDIQNIFGHLAQAMSALVSAPGLILVFVGILLAEAIVRMNSTD